MDTLLYIGYSRKLQVAVLQELPIEICDICMLKAWNKIKNACWITIMKVYSLITRTPVYRHRIIMILNRRNILGVKLLRCIC